MGLAWTIWLLLIMILLALMLPAAARDLTLPDLLLTPGAVVEGTIDKVCHTKWGRDRRNVTARMKREVMANYQFAADLCGSGKIEIDHLIPRELLGADDIRNLWPMCYETGKSDPAFGAHKKDRYENFLHRATCAGAMTLKDAQDEIRTNWVEGYLTHPELRRRGRR